MATSQVTGLSSGIDWAETVELLMEIERQPLVTLESRRDTYDMKLESWQTINTSLLSLKSIMQGMDNLNEILKKSASSTDSSIATATATSAAATGSHTLEVNQLAQGSILVSGGLPDQNSTAVHTGPGDGTFEYEVGAPGFEETYSVTVPAGTTLVELAEIINDDVDNPGVSASVMNDGDEYHLVLSGQTGEENNVALGAGYNLDGLLVGDYTETQTAQDAQIRLDGYPPGDWITSASNTVTEVLDGVNISLKSTNTGDTINLTIENDNSAVKEKIQEFIDAYNEVVSVINAKTKYDEETEIAGPLFGDASANGIRSDLQRIISDYVPGLADDARYQSLGEIGVEFGEDGLLEIDDDKLSDALDEDFNAVGNLFAKTHSSNSNDLTFFYSTNQTAGGVYNVVANYDASGNLISATINGNAATIDGNYIIGAENQPEEGLRIEFDYPGGGAGSTSAEIRLGTGTSVMISNRTDFITDSVDGTIQVAEDGIEDTIESIDRQIERWEERLATKQAQLESAFLNMELVITQLQSTSSYVSAIASSL